MAVEHAEFGHIVHAIRGWDFASSTEEEADYTSSCLMVSTSLNYRIILDVTNDRVAPGSRDLLVRRKAEEDGPGVSIAIEREPGSSGDDVILHYVKLLQEFNVIGRRSSKSKLLRAQGLASWFEHGLMRCLRAAWNSIFFAQLKAFPNGDHDDMVDAASLSFNEIRTMIAELRGDLIASGGKSTPYKPVTLGDLEDGNLKDILTSLRNRRR